MIDIFLKGGPVMYPILLCSIAAVAVVLERFFYLRSIREESDELIKDVDFALEQGRVIEAAQIARSRKGPVARLLLVALANTDKDKEGLQSALEVEGRREIVKMERFLPVLDTVVTIAPLLGLLGTVTGIIQSFNILAATAGITEPAMLSIGIAEALITTAAGLIVAIPAFAFYSLLNTVIDNKVADMNNKAIIIQEMVISRCK